MKASRTSFRLWIVALCALVSMGCTPDDSGEVAASGEPRAIVLITVDGLVAEDLALFGGAVQTPNLTRLAQEGIAWSDVWTVSPLTRPAVATYLTGLTPDRHGIGDDLLARLAPATQTLPGVLAGKGFRTAAFPDTSVLGPSSGLLRDFEIVDDPPPLSMGPITWCPEIKLPGDIGADFEAYLDNVGADERFFAWIHMSGPLNSQVFLEIGKTPPIETYPEGPDRPRLEDAVERVDQALGQIVGALDGHGLLKGSAVVVVGSSGDGRGGPGELPGPGFSLAERAIRVPLIARLPGREAGSTQPRPVWAPDVAVTVAGLAGGELPGSEGIDIFEDAPEDRILFAWSSAPRDQLGWGALRAARSGHALRIEGLGSRTLSLASTSAAVAPALESRLIEALKDRPAVPAPPMLPLESIRPLIEARGIRLNPAPAEGRTIESAERRLEIVELLWNARQSIRQRRGGGAAELYRKVIDLDEWNLAGLLGLGQLRSYEGAAEGRELMARALSRYPDHPEIVHWYAHAIWSEAWQDAEPLIEAVQPHMPNQADVLYDLACTRSLAGEIAGAEKLLRQAIEAGYRRWEHIETDPDLRNLREKRRLAAVMRDYGR